MRHPEERHVLSRAKPDALWRLARWLGLRHKECDCVACIARLVEWCARTMAEANANG